MASLLGWLILIAFGFVTYRAGLYFGSHGAIKFDVFPILCVFGTVELVALAMSVIKVRREKKGE